MNGGVSAGTSLGFIPVYGARGGFEFDTNAKRILGDLDPKSLKSITLGGNVTMIGPIPTWGVDVGFKADKLKGINKQYENIKENSTKLGTDIIAKLKESGALSMDDTNITQTKSNISSILGRRFPNSDADTLKKATDNIYLALKYFGLSDKSSDEEQKVAANLLGDFYATSWKNEAMAGLPDKFKLSGGSVGVQFLAGYYPIPSVALQFTKYHSMYYEDTAKSKELQTIRENTGFGNKEASKTVGDAELGYINSQLSNAVEMQSEDNITMKD